MNRERYSVMGYEASRSDGGFRVYDAERGFYAGAVKDFEGESARSRYDADVFAARLNKENARSLK